MTARVVKRLKRNAPARRGLPAWTPFHRSDFSAETLAQAAKRFGPEVAERMKHSELWRNSRFQVAVTRSVPHGFPGVWMTWLSIKTLHWPQHRHDWRELQRIKNEICGEQCDAIELYPAESRRHDTADQFHLWVLEPGVILPVGFGGRYVSEITDGGSTQRPFEQRPPDLLRDLVALPTIVSWAPGVLTGEEGVSGQPYRTEDGA